MGTKVVIIGGVAGGATAAARARRVDEHAEITIIERGPFVSYANCGLPYAIGGEIEHRAALLLQTPSGFEARYRISALTNTEAVEIDRQARQVRVRDGKGERWVPYDRLILAQGGSPVLPPIAGHDSPHVFRLWTVPDMDRIQRFITETAPQTAVVVGGGFIGLEMAEAFHHRGLSTTVVELMPQPMAVMDPEFGGLVASTLRRGGISVLAGVGVSEVDGVNKTVVLSDGRAVPGGLVLFSVGVRPELTLARRAGLELGAAGGLVVSPTLQTSDPAIFAAGDMVEVEQRVSGRRVRVPLAGPANRQGRIAATNALGGTVQYGGALGTSVVKVLEMTAAMTGLSERAARDAGFDVGVAVIHKDHHASYYPGGKELTLKLVFERPSGRLLGAQAFGEAGVDKRIDVLATALHAKLTLHDLAELDLAYSPPYSSANDPINLAAFVGLNALSGDSPVVTAAGLEAELASARPPLVLDVRTPAEFSKGHLADAVNIPLDALRGSLTAVPRGRRVVVHCKSGYRGHLAVRVLKANGHEDIANVTGGIISLEQHGGFTLV